MNKPFVSVVIPVLNDSKRLKKCLESLEDQTYPKDRYEVIVIDNGSTENIEGIVRQFGQALLVYEKYPSPHAARNKGISLAKGEILAFTDADCIPARNWTDKGVVKLRSAGNNCGLIAGKVEIFFKNPKKPTVVESFESITAFRQKEYTERWHFGVPANLFTFKQVIDKVGLFSGTLKSGADVEWGQRVFSAGYKQIYADDVVVKHPARHYLAELCRKHIRVIGGIYDIERKKRYTFKKFIIDLKDDWPQARDFLNTFSDKRLENFSQSLRVFLVMLLVKFIRTAERIRLYLGGKSKWG